MPLASMADVVAGFVAAVLLYAAWSKADESAAFARSLDWIAKDRRMAVVIAWLVIGVEATLGVGLAIAPTRSMAAGASAALFASFAVVIAWAKVRRANVKCLCFGAAEKPATWSLVARDLALAAAVLPASLAEPQPMPFAVAFGAGVLLVGVLVATMRSVAVGRVA